METQKARVKPPKIKTKPNEIKGARVRLGYTQEYMADMIGVSVHTYRKKENGEIDFSDTEKVIVKRVLDLTSEQVNDFFFDGQLLKDK